MKSCPFRIIADACLDKDRKNFGEDINLICREVSCALWNESLGVCGIVAEAYLKGLEVERKERCLAPGERS